MDNLFRCDLFFPAKIIAKTRSLRSFDGSERTHLILKRHAHTCTHVFRHTSTHSVTQRHASNKTNARELAVSSVMDRALKYVSLTQLLCADFCTEPEGRQR